MIQELRLNNLLDVYSNYWRVSQISNNELYFKENEEYNHILNAKPIELTEEILLKCGFEKKEFDYFILKYGNNECYFSYKRNNLELCRNMQTTASSKIKYLHQLQNLYFALTNQELTINL